MPIQSRLKAYATLVDRRLEAVIPAADDEPAQLHRAMRYSALAPGKRIRPALVLACAEAVGGSTEDALAGACAVELVHSFSLIHDDLPALDNDALRRGRPTCHVEFGEAVAILAGDALFALAFQCLAEAKAPADRLLRSMQTLTRATAMLVNGETVDILSEGKEYTAETLQLIHERKTGALLRSSCEIGALLGGGSDRQVQALGEFGQQVGLAFQIADDLLNETSTPEQLGKAAGSDRARGKATYPALFGLDNSKKAAIDAAERGIELLSCVEDREFLEGIARYAVERVH